MEICGACQFDFAMATCRLGKTICMAFPCRSIDLFLIWLWWRFSQRCPWTSLRDLFVLARHRTRVYGSRWDHSSFATCDFCTARMVTNGQARLASNLTGKQDKTPWHSEKLWAFIAWACEVASGSHFPHLTVDFSLFQMDLRVPSWVVSDFRWPTQALPAVNDLCIGPWWQNEGKVFGAFGLRRAAQRHTRDHAQ